MQAKPRSAPRSAPPPRSRVLAAKLAPPPASPFQLPRERLVRAFDAPGTRLVLVRAPGGFGKTTLLQQYHASAQSAGHGMLWLTLDAADNDLSRFVEHLAAASVSIAGDAGTIDDLPERLAACARPFAILLDEFEAIHAAPVLDYVRQLLDLLPPHALLVIATRNMPDLNLGRLRARGQMLEIGPAALRFSLDEATAFVRHQRRLPLGDDDIAALHRGTEGWIAAMFLATLSLETRTDHAGFVASFSGRNHELAQYLAEDVLGRQDAASRDFLLRTSVLGPLCAGLCDAVLGRHDSGRMIEALSQANLFLFRLDDEGNWYRYHALFAGFLRDRLDKDHPGTAQALHRAAAAWYARAGRPVPAVEHLLEAGAGEEALDTIAGCVRELQETGRVRLLVRWFDQIPHATLAQQPRLQFAYAWALAVHRRYADATRVLDALPGAQTDPQIESLRFTMLALTDQVQACCERGADLQERLSADDFFHHAAVANSYAWALATAQRHTEARAVLAGAIRRDARLQSGVMRLVAASIECHIDLTHGQLRNARARLSLAGRHDWEATRQAQARGDLHGGSATPAGVVLPLALTLYEAGEHDEASRVLAEVMPYVKSSGTTEALIACHLLTARLAARRGDLALSQRTLAELEQLGRGEGGLRLVCSAWLERARLATIEDQFDAAQRALRSAGLASHWMAPDLSFMANDVDDPFIGRARLRIAMRDCEGLAADLEAAIGRAEAAQRLRRALKLRILLAMCHDAEGRPEAADIPLAQALGMAAEEGFVSTFLDEGARLLPVLQRCAARQGSGKAAAYAAHLLGMAGVPVEMPEAEPEPVPALQTQTLAEPLSTREQQILRLLALGLRNRGIADKLFLSELTVKSHLRNIYGKIGAGGRTEAVAIARRLGVVA